MRPSSCGPCAGCQWQVKDRISGTLWGEAAAAAGRCGEMQPQPQDAVGRCSRRTLWGDAAAGRCGERQPQDAVGRCIQACWGMSGLPFSHMSVCCCADVPREQNHFPSQRAGGTSEVLERCGHFWLLSWRCFCVLTPLCEVCERLLAGPLKHVDCSPSPPLSCYLELLWKATYHPSLPGWHTHTHTHTLG